MTRAEKAERNKAMREYKAKGHTMQEVADKFGVCEGTAGLICKGIAQQKPELKGKTRNQWTSKPFQLRESKAIETINKHLPSFEYVGGFVNCDGSVDLRCKVCGTVVTRSLIGIRHGNGVTCPVCKETEKEKKRIEQEQRIKNKKLQRDRAAILRKIDKYKQISFKVCAECGSVFVPSNSNQKCCSLECSKKRANRKKDNRINKNNIVDRDITLTKLYSKHHGKCYICGCLCDWDDKVMDGNGNMIVGGRYPTIEHVQPLSKGGKHSWSNVKLACFSCNTIKGNSPLPKFGN